MLPTILFLWLMGSSPCHVSAQPSIGTTPFRHLRITTHLDEPAHWRRVDLVLVGEAGVVTSSQVCEDDSCQFEPRTKHIEWKYLDLDPGAYELRLIAVNAQDHCESVTRIEVQ